MSKNIYLFNKLINIIKIFFLVITALVIGINLYYLNAIKLLGDAMPMPNGYGVAVVLSGSMEPELSINDLIVVEKKSKYEENDVVVFQKQNELIVHRIIEINGSEVITKGDANRLCDDPISISDIKGEVIKSVSNVGAIINFIKSPIGVLIIISITIFIYIYSYAEEKKKKEMELNEIRKAIEELKMKL